VLYDYAQKVDGDEVEALEELTVVGHGQRVCAEVVRDYLKRITWGSDGYAVAIPLPGYTQAEVIADIRRGFGQPTSKHGGSLLEEVLALFYAGESAATVAEEFGLTQVARRALRQARRRERRRCRLACARRREQVAGADEGR
jgi:hypothetical protein